MRLSVQCFTLRDEFARGVWKTFEAVRQIGFNYVELAGSYGLTPAELRSGLDRLGLQVSGSHVPLEELEKDLERVIEDSYTLDNRYLIVPWAASEAYRDGWSVLGHRLDHIGERVREAGLWLAYHNHDFEFAIEGGRYGLDILFESAQEDNLLAQIDTAWVHHAGADPAGLIRRHGKRAALVHLKDFAKGGEDSVAGEGELDWSVILAACKEVEVEFGTVEMDNPPGPPIDCVRRCALFFQERGVPF